MMPGTDGFELASLIRQRERLRHTPIIFLTGMGADNVQMLLQGYRSGAVDYLTKPCDPEVLRCKVKIFVELAKQRDLRQRYAALVEGKNRQLEISAQTARDALARTLQMNAALQREIVERKRAEAIRDRLADNSAPNPTSSKLWPKAPLPWRSISAFCTATRASRPCWAAAWRK